jgi:hypothetical protein
MVPVLRITGTSPNTGFPVNVLYSTGVVGKYPSYFEMFFKCSISDNSKAYSISLKNRLITNR